MKRCIALLLVILLLCGCSGKETTETTDVMDSPEDLAGSPALTYNTSARQEQVGIAVLPEDLAVSLALTYNTSAWQEPIDPADPLFFWQTVGWYIVYTGHLTGTESTDISAKDADVFRQIISPDSDAIRFPVDFPYGSVTESGYSFDGTKVYSDSYIGIVAEIYAEMTDGFCYLVSIIDHYDDSVTENCYRITFSGTLEDFRLESIEKADLASFSDETDQEKTG